jgi:hypothetical protein
MTEQWNQIGAELWLAAQPIAGTQSRSIRAAAASRFCRIPTCSTPHCPADVLAILRPAKAGILRILKWRDPARAPFRVGRPINASEGQWDAALFSLRHFIDGG